MVLNKNQIAGNQKGLNIVGNTALIVQFSSKVISEKINKILEKLELISIDSSVKNELYKAISTITQKEEGKSLNIKELCSEFFISPNFFNERTALIKELIQKQDLPYLELNGRHNDIVSSMYFYDFLDLTGIGFNELINEINSGKFTIIQTFLEEKNKILDEHLQNNSKNTFLYIIEYSEIIQIINSILILPGKNSENFNQIQDFIDFLSTFLGSIIEKVQTNINSNNNLLEDNVNKLKINYLKLLRNHVKKVCYKGKEDEYQIKNLCKETNSTIVQLNQSILSILEKTENSKAKNLEKEITKLLKATASINMYENFIFNGLKINSKDKKRLKFLLSLIIESKTKGTNIDMQIVIKLANILIDRYNENGEKANIDVLTKILNKRSHDKQLVKTISGLKGKNRKNDVNGFPSLKPFYFIMDIDYFKKFNDEYGHQTGDAVLHHFAQLINKLLRNGDNIYRYGGEEFSIITLPTNLEGAIGLANKIKNALIESPYIDKNGKKYNITISIGISEFSESLCNMDLKGGKIIEEADQALYLAKANGRNRFELSDDLDKEINYNKNKYVPNYSI